MNAKQIKKLIPASSVLPYLRHIDEETVKTSKGDYLRTYEIKGIPFLTMSDDELEAWQIKKEMVFKNMAHSRLCLWTHFIREKYDDKLHAKFDNANCQEIHDAYTNDVLKDTYIIKYFVTVIIRGETDFEVIRNMIDKGGKLTDATCIRFLDQRCSLLQTNLEEAGIGSLKLINDNDLIKSNFCSFISKIYNGKFYDTPVTSSPLSKSIAKAGILFSNEVVEQRDTSESRHGVMLAIKDIEAGTLNANRLTDLLNLDFEFVLSQSFTYMKGQKYSSFMRSKARDIKLVSGDILELEAVKKRIDEGEIVIGQFHMTLFTHHNNVNIASKNLEEAEGILTRGSINSIRTLGETQGAYLSQMPGNHKDIVKKITITNENLSALNGFYNHDYGKKHNNHWGDCLFQAMTTAKTPYHVNVHVADVGNTGIYGSVGTGKTVLENLIIMNMQKFNPTTTSFDSKQNARPFIKMLGGDYYDFNPGQDTGCLPFQLPVTTRNIEFIKKLIEICCEEVGPKLSLDEIKKINSSIDTFMSNKFEKHQRNFTMFKQFFSDTGTGSLFDRIAIWTKGQKLGWVFDGDKSSLDLSNRVVGFDTDEILNMDKAQTPLMAYLFHCNEMKKDNSPFVTIFAEFHQMLDHDYFIDVIRHGLKTDRDKNVSYIYSTQSVEDAVQSKIGTAVKDQTATNFLLPNPNGEYEFYKKLSITKEEFMFIKRSTTESRQVMVKQQERAQILDFNLSGIKRYFPVLSANKQLNRLFDECVENNQDNWFKQYLEEANA